MGWPVWPSTSACQARIAGTDDPVRSSTERVLERLRDARPARDDGDRASDRLPHGAQRKDENAGRPPADEPLGARHDLLPTDPRSARHATAREYRTVRSRHREAHRERPAAAGCGRPPDEEAVAPRR